MLERLFQLSAARTNVRTEVVAGVTTFLAMAYIIFVQPTVLSATGMDRGAVLTATCLASAIATLIMAFAANYPIAVAPAMGHNFFFAFTVVQAGGTPWPVALGAVALAGIAFVLTAGVGLRERVITAIPESLKHAISVGIGLLIALVGLEWGGIVVDSPATLVTLGPLGSPPVLLTLGTLALMAVLAARGVAGALLIGMAAATVVALATGLTTYEGVVSTPPSLAPTFLKLDILGALQPALIDAVIVFFFLALFDSIGTLVGVAGRIGVARNGTLPRAKQALLADAVGTVIGAGLGTSTVTAYVESSAGVAAGGRTGLANVVTAALFLCALFFNPLVKMIGGGYSTGAGPTLYPIVAPALILVGVMMMESVQRIRWNDFTEAVPAFSDAAHDAAGVQHHGRHCLRLYCVRDPEARDRPLARARLARVPVRAVVLPEVRVSVGRPPSLITNHCHSATNHQPPAMDLLITPVDLSNALTGSSPPLLIDGRPAEEFARGQIPGAVHLDLWGVSLIDTSDAPLKAFMWMIGHLFALRGVSPDRAGRRVRARLGTAGRTDVLAARVPGSSERACARWRHSGVETTRAADEHRARCAGRKHLARRAASGQDCDMARRRVPSRAGRDRHH